MQGTRRIGFKQFLAAVEQLAVEKGMQKGAPRSRPASSASHSCRAWLAPDGLLLQPLQQQARQGPPSCPPSVATWLLWCSRAEELLAQIARCPGPSINGALTPEQTAVPFGPRRALSGAAAEAAAAGLQEQPEADAAPAVPAELAVPAEPTLPAEAARLDDSAADLPAGQQAEATPAGERPQDETAARDAAEAASGIGKL